MQYKKKLWKGQKVAEKVPENTHHQILFTDEKIFNIKERFNHQDDHIYAKSFYKAILICEGSEGSLPPPQIGNGLVGSFVLWWNLD